MRKRIQTNGRRPSRVEAEGRCGWTTMSSLAVMGQAFPLLPRDRGDFSAGGSISGIVPVFPLRSPLRLAPALFGVAES